MPASTSHSAMIIQIANTVTRALHSVQICPTCAVAMATHAANLKTASTTTNHSALETAQLTESQPRAGNRHQPGSQQATEPPQLVQGLEQRMNVRLRKPKHQALPRDRIFLLTILGLNTLPAPRKYPFGNATSTSFPKPVPTLPLRLLSIRLLLL